MRFSFVSLLLAILFSSLAIAHEYKVGDRVMVIADARLTAAGRGETDKVFLGLFLDVHAVNNRWLWVSHVKSGWLDKKHVIPADDAFDYLTNRYANEKSNRQIVSALAFLWQERTEYEIAISLYNDLINLDPRAAAYFNNRGNCWADQGNYDKAIADYNQAIKIDPKSAFAYKGRGAAWHNKGNYNKAIDDYTHAIKIEPQYVGAIYGRGLAWRRSQNYERAIADYSLALKIDPKSAEVHNEIAWLRGTCPNSIYRNGQQAIINAKQAVELTAEKDANNIDTLAAAYAEVGEFAAAIKWATKARDFAPAAEKAEYQTRLDLYKSGKPYRETVD